MKSITRPALRLLALPIPRPNIHRIHHIASPEIHRGGHNLTERFAHLAERTNTYVDATVSQLSEQGLASETTSTAASRLVREGTEYTSVNGVRIPVKPKPPADDGMLPTLLMTCSVVIYDSLC